jgi:hypothetical protein
MLIDISISVALAVLTMHMGFLGVHVTLHPIESQEVRNRYKAGFVLCALASVFLVIWQGFRNGTTQSELRSTVKKASESAETATKRIDQLTTEQRSEVARREQAEHDLAIIVQSTGKATRQGVAEDIKNNPLKVSVNGVGGHTDAERKRREDVRVHLGYLMSEGRAIMAFCLNPPPAQMNFSCDAAAKQWQVKAGEYIRTNMDASYSQRFASATGLGVSWNTDEKTNSILIGLKHHTDALETFIKELLD